MMTIIDWRQRSSLTVRVSWFQAALVRSGRQNIQGFLVAHMKSKTANLTETPLWIFLSGNLLTLIAGFVDGVGYAQLGQLYLSFVSGNSAQLGFAIAAWDGDAVARISVVVALFALGVGGGTLIADATGSFAMPVVLGVEVLLFCLALLQFDSHPGSNALLFLAPAMGMQNILPQKLWRADLGKGFVTGTLVSAGQNLARALRQRSAAIPGLISLFSWLIFVCGVVVGARVLANLGTRAALMMAGGLLFAMVIVTLIPPISSRRQRHA